MLFIALGNNVKRNILNFPTLSVIYYEEIINLLVSY